MVVEVDEMIRGSLRKNEAPISIRSQSPDNEHCPTRRPAFVGKRFTEEPMKVHVRFLETRGGCCSPEVVYNFPLTFTVRSV